MLSHLSRSRSRSPAGRSPSSLRVRSLSGSSLPECLVFTSGPPLRVPPRPPPSRRGSHPFTVRPRSTSTRTRRESIFFPSACLYAAIREIRRIPMTKNNHTHTKNLTNQQMVFCPEWAADLCSRRTFFVVDIDLPLILLFAFNLLQIISHQFWVESQTMILNKHSYRMETLDEF